MGVYFVFERNMSRYVLLLLPYFFLCMAFELHIISNQFTGWVKKVSPNQVLLIKSLSLLLFFLVLIFQIVSTITFPKYNNQDYHGEISNQIINLINDKEKSLCATTTKPTILVAQQDPFLWADFDRKYQIQFLDKESYTEAITNMKNANIQDCKQNRVYIVQDQAIDYKDSYFKEDQNLLLIQNNTQTQAPFWVNDIKTNGWYKLWFGSW